MRLNKERLAELRADDAMYVTTVSIKHASPLVRDRRDLRRELDAVRAERDALLKAATCVNEAFNWAYNKKSQEPASLPWRLSDDCPNTP